MTRETSARTCRLKRREGGVVAYWDVQTFAVLDLPSIFRMYDHGPGQGPSPRPRSDGTRCRRSRVSRGGVVLLGGHGLGHGLCKAAAMSNDNMNDKF